MLTWPFSTGRSDHVGEREFASRNISLQRSGLESMVFNVSTGSVGSIFCSAVYGGGGDGKLWTGAAAALNPEFWPVRDESETSSTVGFGGEVGAGCGFLVENTK